MEVPRVGNKLVETKYDVCASRVFSSVSSNIELWVVFPLTFDYIKLSSWLSNTPTSEKTEKWVSLSLSVWSNILQRWNRRAGAWSIGHMLHVWAIFLWDAGRLTVATGATFELEEAGYSANPIYGTYGTRKNDIFHPQYTLKHWHRLYYITVF